MTSIPDRRHPSQAVWWVIAVSLALIAFRLVVQPGGGPLSPTAMAQMGTGGGAGGVFAFTGQISKGTYGVFMIDVDAGTIWAYEYNSARKCLELAAGRLWRYDRYLEEFNVCGLTPEEVKNLLDEQRRLKLKSAVDEGPESP